MIQQPDIQFMLMFGRAYAGAGQWCLDLFKESRWRINLKRTRYKFLNSSSHQLIFVYVFNQGSSLCICALIHTCTKRESEDMVSALFRPSYGVGWLLWGRLLVVGAGVGASRGVPAFRHARGRPPGGSKDWPRLQKKKKKKKWTSLLDKQADQPLTKQWFCERNTAF